ncbi:MAG: HDOD domain-containing protein [Pseudomonadota bacterium]
MTERLAFDEVVALADRTLRVPAVLNAVFNRSAADDCELDELIALLGADPVFAAQVLRLANCPLYYRGSTLTAIDQAVVRLGRRVIHDMAAALICVNAVEKMPSDTVRMADFLFQSLHAAHTAANLSDHGICEPSPAYTAALFSGIGTMVLVHARPADMRAVLNWSLEVDVPLSDTVDTAFGFGLYDLSAAIGRLWELPEPVVEAMTHAGDRDGATGRGGVAECVNAATRLVEACGGESVAEDVIPLILDILAGSTLSRIQSDDVITELDAAKQSAHAVLRGLM